MRAVYWIFFVASAVMVFWQYKDYASIREEGFRTLCTTKVDELYGKPTSGQGMTEQKHAELVDECMKPQKGTQPPGA